MKITRRSLIKRLAALPLVAPIIAALPQPAQAKAGVDMEQFTGLHVNPINPYASPPSAPPIRAHYYVNSRYGDDANDGLTPETAFKTLSRAAQVSDFDSVVTVGAGMYSNANLACRKIAAGRDLWPNPDDESVKIYNNILRFPTDARYEPEGLRCEHGHLKGLLANTCYYCERDAMTWRDRFRLKRGQPRSSLL
jgi:hypothetical protein